MKKAFPLITITSLVINLSVVFQTALQEFFGKNFKLEAIGIIPAEGGRLYSYAEYLRLYDKIG